VAWTDVQRVERMGNNKTGEALGLLVGGVVGGLTGYFVGNLLSDDPLATLGFLPGAFLGIPMGGVIGAHVGDRWHDVPASRPVGALRVAIPLGRTP
jgi:hypothetical protein